MYYKAQIGRAINLKTMACKTKLDLVCIGEEIGFELVNVSGNDELKLLATNKLMLILSFQKLSNSHSFFSGARFGTPG
jgi:hypothetical protein